MGYILPLAESEKNFIVATCIFDTKKTIPITIVACFFRIKSTSSDFEIFSHIQLMGVYNNCQRKQP
jgi:hypothetical protein